VAVALVALVVVSAAAAGAVSARTDAPAPLRQSAPAQQNATVTLDYEGDGPTLRASSEQTVRGETTLSPDTELTVRLRASGGGTQFIRSKTTTVGDDGQFRVAFDLRDLRDGDGGPVTVTVRGEGETLTTVDGTLVTPTPTPTTTTSDTSVPGFGVGVALAALFGVVALLGRRRGRAP
jgi:PGF-CTERM protein